MEDFSVTMLRPHVLQLENRLGNCATLVLGKEKAILFDTMAGIGDLKGYVAGLTRLPVIVINSHGHFDHMGGNHQFERAFLHPLDRPLLPQFEHWLEVIGRNAGADLSGTKRSYHLPTLPLEEGMQWDLGGLTARSVSLPGHTPGSMGLLLVEDRILLAGDAISPQMCLFFPESQPLAVYLRTLERVLDMDIDWFVQGHYRTVFPKRLMDRLLACAKLPEQQKGYPYVNTLIPELTGQMYILEFRNADAQGTVCIITKEEACP